MGSQEVEDLGRISRPHLVIEVGDLVEGELAGSRAAASTATAYRPSCVRGRGVGESNASRDHEPANRGLWEPADRPSPGCAPINALAYVGSAWAKTMHVALNHSTVQPATREIKRVPFHACAGYGIRGNRPRASCRAAGGVNPGGRIGSRTCHPFSLYGTLMVRGVFWGGSGRCWPQSRARVASAWS